MRTELLKKALFQHLREDSGNFIFEIDRRAPKGLPQGRDNHRDRGPAVAKIEHRRSTGIKEMYAVQTGVVEHQLVIDGLFDDPRRYARLPVRAEFHGMRQGTSSDPANAQGGGWVEVGVGVGPPLFTASFRLESVTSAGAAKPAPKVNFLKNLRRSLDGSFLSRISIFPLVICDRMNNTAAQRKSTKSIPSAG